MCTWHQPDKLIRPESNAVPSEIFILEYIWECLALDVEQDINIKDLSYEISRDAPVITSARLVYFYWVLYMGRVHYKPFLILLYRYVLYFYIIDQSCDRDLLYEFIFFPMRVLSQNVGITYLHINVMLIKYYHKKSIKNV